MLLKKYPTTSDVSPKGNMQCLFTMLDDVGMVLGIKQASMYSLDSEKLQMYFDYFKSKMFWKSLFCRAHVSKYKTAFISVWNAKKANYFNTPKRRTFIIDVFVHQFALGFLVSLICYCWLPSLGNLLLYGKSRAQKTQFADEGRMAKTFKIKQNKKSYRDW